MKESELQAFFEGRLDPETLTRAADGFLEIDGPTTTGRPICDLPAESPLRVADLVTLCDAVLGGRMPPAALCSIGFFLIACDNFAWDTEISEGNRISEALHDWAAPEINYPLTIENVRRCKDRLQSP